MKTIAKKKRGYSNIDCISNNKIAGFETMQKSAILGDAHGPWARATLGAGPALPRRAKTVDLRMLPKWIPKIPQKILNMYQQIYQKYTNARPRA